MIQDDFIFRLFFGSLASMLLSIVFFAVCIFLAAKILNEKQNKPATAIQVALVAFLAGIAARMLAFVDQIFLVALQFAGALLAIKYFYKTNYSNAALLLVLAVIIFIILELLIAPWIIGF